MILFAIFQCTIWPKFFSQNSQSALFFCLWLAIVCLSFSLSPILSLFERTTTDVFVAVVFVV